MSHVIKFRLRNQSKKTLVFSFNSFIVFIKCIVIYFNRRKKPTMLGYLLDQFYKILAVAVTIFTFWYIWVNEQWIALIYLLLINAWAIELYYRDKCYSNNPNRWRISEKLLVWIGIFGGWIGAIFAQQRFRHKTRKWSFQFNFFFSIGLNMCIIYYRNDIISHFHDKIFNN